MVYSNLDIEYFKVNSKPIKLVNLQINFVDKIVKNCKIEMEKLFGVVGKVLLIFVKVVFECRKVNRI